MEEISLKAQELFKIGGLDITNSFLLTLVVSSVLLIGAFFINRKITIIPGKLQGAAEMGMESLLGLMESTLGSIESAQRYFPLIATIFIFILTSNLLGTFPGVGSFIFETEGKEVSLFRSPASDLNFTLAFAVVSVVVTNILGMVAVGAFSHLGKFFNFSNPINFFVGMLELVSEFVKIISLSFRLFGNVFAGEVLLTIIFFLAPYFMPLPFMFLEFFIGSIQAFIFAMITLVSLSLHTAIHEH
ncbi:MAG: F0F1 ATP synthase subunit A [Candidatus Staskawiczbacteria bacterium]|nr:F0F1 ATP synthase subunit A [Candidatus Staskawiczbacteria bacterium]